MTDAQRIRQLERHLAECDGISPVDRYHKVEILNELAWALSDTDMHRAYELSEKAYALASAPDTGAPSDQGGIAYSLRTQGYINQRLGDYPLGLEQLLKAQSICESLQLPDGLCDVLDGIAGIYAQIGDFPEALHVTHKQLETAERIGDRRRIANAYNNLAAIYVATHDLQRGAEFMRHNLTLAEEIGSARTRCITHLNLAETYLLTGDFERAREHGLVGLRISQEAGYQLFTVYALTVLGKAFAKLGDASQAIGHLVQALATSRILGSKVTEAFVLRDLGRAYRDMQRLDLALDYLQQTVIVAQPINAKGELSNAHLLLSEVYEQMGDAVQALAHYKLYHEFMERVAGEKADQRLKVLQVVYDTETAKKEAEIAQLRSVELQQQVEERTAELRDTVDLLRAEIEERQRAERALQEMAQSLENRLVARTEDLAAFFDLTLLGSQGLNLADVFEQIMPRILEATRSRAVCVHLLDTDRTALRLMAQQNIAPEVKEKLARVEPPPALQSWLQTSNHPLVIAPFASDTSIPASLRIPEYQSYLGSQIRIGQQTEGILSCFRFSKRGFSVDEIALVTALAEQMGMMLETDRLRHNAEEMAVLEERQRLARDLHDSLTQSLYSLSLFSRACREAAEDGDANRLMTNLAELERNTLHALREMRLLLYELRPADLEREGLIRAVELRLNTVERRVGLRLDVRLDHLPDLSSSLEVELYHIIVEALNNIVKHAAAGRLVLQLFHANGSIHLQIADDGQGFDPSQTNGGLGLRNIRERVSKLNGALAIASEPGQGTHLDVVIPCGAEVH